MNIPLDELIKLRDQAIAGRENALRQLGAIEGQLDLLMQLIDKAQREQLPAPAQDAASG